MEMNNVIGVQLSNFGENVEIIVVNSDGKKERYTVKKTMHIIVEVTGRVSNLEVCNCCTIFGNVEKVMAGNSVKVEGLVSRFRNIRATLKVDDKVKITYGNERRKRNQMDSVRHRIVRINGDSVSGIHIVRENHVCNVPLEIVVHGNVDTVKAGNCVEVKGNVEEVEARNSIVATQGIRSKAKSTRELQRIYAEREKQMNSAFDTLFNSMIK